MLASPPSDRYIPALTGLRAVAAGLVFLHHYNLAPPGTFGWHLFNQGYIGVTIFFVLSGFLLYHRYADAYIGQKNWSWARYLQNRFARIYPLYAFLLLITAGLLAGRGHPLSLVVFGLNLTLLKGFFGEYLFSSPAQSWSLTVELSFYLLAPFLFLSLARWGAGWLALGLAGAGGLLWLTVGQRAWHGLFGTWPFVAFYTLFGRGFEFIVGMWLARRWHQKQLPTVPYLVEIGLCIMVVCTVWQALVPLYTTNATGLAGSELFTYNIILPVGIGFVLHGLIGQPSVAGRLLAHPLMQALGQWSYAFYLIQVGVIARGLQRAGVTHRGLLFMLLIALSYVLYRFVEKPGQRLFRAKERQE